MNKNFPYFMYSGFLVENAKKPCTYLNSNGKAHLIEFFSIISFKKKWFGTKMESILQRKVTC